jgi:hypothetical protein
MGQARVLPYRMLPATRCLRYARDYNTRHEQQVSERLRAQNRFDWLVHRQPHLSKAVPGDFRCQLAVIEMATAYNSDVEGENWWMNVLRVQPSTAAVSQGVQLVLVIYFQFLLAPRIGACYIKLHNICA